jgi:hypothetical protein
VLVRGALETGEGAISWQVAQEFLNVALHRFERPLTPREAADYLDEVQSGRELRGLRIENPFA